MKRCYYLLTLLLGSTFCAYAENPTEQAPNQNLELNFCPAIEKIMHDSKTKLWGIGNWVSTEASEDEKLASFQGAQWVGTNVGTVICVYKSTNPTSFPITIQNSTLAQEPTGPNWGKYQDGRKNCPPFTSNELINVKDCPFYFRKKETAPKDIYQALDFFKDKKEPS